MSNIELQEDGARVYIAGDTFAIKSAIKSAGGHWDADRRQWWVGKAKRDAIASVIAKAEPSAEQSDRAVTVIGKASYKGRSYFVRWSGRCKSGEEKMRLVTLDGKIDFWADLSACQLLKEYTEAKDLAGIRRFIEQKKAIEKGGDCPKCSRMERAGKWAPYCGSGDYDTCSMCGATVMICY